MLLFEDPLAFCDFVRVQGSGAQSTRGYTLLRLRAANRPQIVLLGLIGYAPSQKTLETISARQVEADIEADGAGQWKEPATGADQPFRVLGAETGHTLLEMVALSPWRGEPVDIGFTLFWLRRDDLLADLVRDSLRLGNDRMRYARVSGADEESALLLRVEGPSYFLVQQYREDHPGDVEVYHPQAEDLYLPWGYDHPLADLWRLSRMPRDQSWTVFLADGSHLAIVPPRWLDIYDAMAFELALSPTPNWRQDDARALRFPVPLRLEKKAKRDEPELWMLGPGDLPRLERLLAGTDQEDIANIQLSIHRTDGGDPVFFLRERVEKGGANRKFLDFGGMALASYKGFKNLLLPAGSNLQPQLRRDAYRPLFELRPGVLTLLLPAEGDGGMPRVARVREESFEPFDRLIDYLATEHQQALEEVVGASVFDIGHYATSPPAGGLERPKPRAVKQDSVAEEEPEEDGKLVPANGPRADNARLPELPRDIPVETEMDSAEAAAERHLIQEGQTLEGWRELLAIKRSAGKQAEAAICCVQALWLAEEDPQAETDLLRTWRTLIQPRKSQPAADDPLPTQLAMRILDGRGLPPEDIDGWVAKTAPNLKQAEERLSMKSRWLLWREILRQNRDVRELARLREAFQKRITNEGLSLEEIPNFLRTRLFLDKSLSENTADEETRRDLGAAMENLRVLLASLPLDHPVLSPVLKATVARGYARSLGESERAGHLFNEANEGANGNPALLAWIALFAAHAYEHSPQLATDMLDRYRRSVEELPPSDKRELKTLEDSLVEREKNDNPAALLTADNASRFYPSGGRFSTGPAHTLAENLTAAYTEADVPRMIELLRQAMTDQALLTSEELVVVTRLIEVVQDGLGRLKFDRRAFALRQSYPDFAAAMQKLGKGAPDPFFPVLKDIHLMQGMIRLDFNDQAAALARDVIDRAGQLKVTLDFVDATAAVLRAIEEFPLAARTELLRLVGQGLARQVAEHANQISTGSGTTVQLFRLLDQAVEAAVSKEKVAMGLYRDYAQQDEFLILERVLREDLCGGP